MILVTAEEMQRMDHETIHAFGLPGRVLMESAGRGAARVLQNFFKNIPAMDIAVAAGRGNNGGDGFVIARCLAQQGVRVTVYLMSAPSAISGDAAANLDLLSPLGVPVVSLPDAAAVAGRRQEMLRHALWVDALLGTGLNADVRGHTRDMIALINDSGRPVFAVDIPSGVNADTGQICGIAVSAAATATFAFAKIGHRQYPGAARCGHLEIIDIGIPPHIARAVGPRQFQITPALVAGHMTRRPPDAHKGTTGHLLVIAGSPGKTGAAAMCVNAALRSGAGLVTAGVPSGILPAMEVLSVEGMAAALPQTDDGLIDERAAALIDHLLVGKRAVAVGPGLGTSAGALAVVHHIVTRSTVPVVVDADGLTALSRQPSALAHRQAPVILTPHPGEMARLCSMSTAAVQADRMAVSRKFAVDNDVTLVLKGARTLVAAPDGRVYLNPTGNPGMATGGMGDILTGMIAGLIVQGLSPVEAAIAGTYLHGAAADHLSQNIGPAGYLATDILGAIAGRMAAVMSCR
ncbi:MAG: NAD(P)H-hydrate dehydratase [Pseudomonadota bacterium]